MTARKQISCPLSSCTISGKAFALVSDLIYVLFVLCLLLFRTHTHSLVLLHFCAYVCVCECAESSIPCLRIMCTCVSAMCAGVNECVCECSQCIFVCLVQCGYMREFLTRITAKSATVCWLKNNIAFWLCKCLFFLLFFFLFAPCFFFFSNILADR